MPATGYATMQQKTSGTWTPFQATVFIVVGSILLWATLIAVARWLI